ncbi:MAG: helix-turn-helix domain-containing protein, partial [Gammaproteobacteria bacterium]|nr:helix-turn-helix domain-containing protein [Gammaproteobacteria bacterium]
LSGRNATTSSLLCDQLSNGYPEVNVLRDRLLVQDGKIFTSSGRLSCIDLALELIKQDWGKDFSLYVSRYFSIYLANTKSINRRESSETALSPADTKIKLLSDWITAHLDRDLRVDELAFQVAMSPRNFARWITQKTGVSPARYVETIRLERAKFLLETSEYSLESIAEKSGFVTLQTLRRVFARHLKIAPKDYRKAFNKKNIQQLALNGPDPISGFFDTRSSTETELQLSGHYNLEGDLPFRSIYQQTASGIQGEFVL